MKTSARLVLILVALAGACSVQQGDPADPSVRSQQRPIVGGSLDTNPAHAGVAYISVYDATYAPSEFCSGTLISSNVVLTAGHCLSTIHDPKRYGVYFDTDNDGWPDWPSHPKTVAQNVTAVALMPGYKASWSRGSGAVNDIALLRLSSPAPQSVTPIPYLTPSLAGSLQAGATVEFVGFGEQNYPRGGMFPGDYECCSGFMTPPLCYYCKSGTRFHVSAPLSATCTDPNGCADKMPPWTVSYTGDKQTCMGDSGGPALLTVDERQYVAAVTSYGSANCTGLGVSTRVDHYVDTFECFLSASVGTVTCGLGRSCGVDGDCQSGHCVGSTCCDSACTSPCMTCRSGDSPGHCRAVSDGTACASEDQCKRNETCHSGACTDGTPIDCDSHSACLADSCDPKIGCVHIPANQGGPCPDSSPCLTGSTCHDGERAGAPRSCDDGNPCTLDSCDATKGCQHAKVEENKSCGSVASCLTCIQGACTVGLPSFCDDKDAHTIDRCLVGTGCAHYPPPTISPSGAKLQPGATLTFTASGGSGTGFTWSLVSNGSGGSISPTGVYTAGQTNDLDVVQVTDSVGNTATCTVVVGLVISPKEKSVPPSSDIQFSALGGAGTCEWTIPTNASGAIIDRHRGLYTSGPTGGVTDVVQVVDTVGSVATAKVTVTGSSGCGVAGGSRVQLVAPVLAALLIRRRRRHPGGPRPSAVSR